MTGYDLTRPSERLRAYGDMVFKDHAFLRVGFANARWVDADLARTNQPWPFQLQWWRDQGIRTVINLRGDGYETSFFVLEREACARLGLTLVNFSVASREAPSAQQVRGAKALFETAEWPALMHCKSGADRAGVMAVLYAHFKMGLPLREAVARELSLRTLHMKQGETGVLDYTFERYFAEGEPAGLSFYDWTQSPSYDPRAIRAAFKATKLGRFLTEKVLRRE